MTEGEIATFLSVREAYLPQERLFHKRVDEVITIIVERVCGGWGANWLYHDAGPGSPGTICIEDGKLVGFDIEAYGIDSSVLDGLLGSEGRGKCLPLADLSLSDEEVFSKYKNKLHLAGSE